MQVTQGKEDRVTGFAEEKLPEGTSVAQARALLGEDDLLTVGAMGTLGWWDITAIEPGMAEYSIATREHEIWIYRAR